MTMRENVATATQRAICFILVVSQAQYLSAMRLNPKVVVSCEDPKAMEVTIDTPGTVAGAIYVKDQVKNPKCLLQPTSAKTVFVIPFDTCGTLKENEIYTTTIIIQRHATVVTSEDISYRIQCSFDTGLQTILNSDVDLNDLKPINVNNTAAPPRVTMNVYDFVADQFVTKLKLGEVYELEIDITNGRMYGGFVRNCKAISGDGMVYQLLDDKGCPTDTSIFGKAYTDDQSMNTGHLFIYMPFEAFKFAENSKVRFQCTLVMCRGTCEATQCGEEVGETFGRKRRAANEDEDEDADVVEEVAMTRGFEVITEDDTSLREMLAQDDNVKRKLMEEASHLPWIVLTALLATLLIVSFVSNILFFSKLRRHRAECAKYGIENAFVAEPPKYMGAGLSSHGNSLSCDNNEHQCRNAGQLPANTDKNSRRLS
ncbi:PREDICTED: cuticlin-1-like [Priapulus caudatus]|uniref:Cuticlin-1-like n=1 Tax=Priapulus caudatus TaxID=37621 RepID=A0ABM1EUA8_PRICU|nr:PREDICTED: cuticlin-1-like [Priapulus caudatus]